MTMIITYGLKSAAYMGYVQRVLTLDDLFLPSSEKR